jgi:predicted membrane-bound mannosyltransferase
MAKKGKKTRVAGAKPAAASTEEKAASIKEQRVRKQKQPAADAPKLEISDKSWRICAIGITVLGALLRFAFLGLKPFHHDEGVNGFFLTSLLKDGNYHYDPANYHGPTLYFLTLPWAEIFGLNTIPVRMPMAIFGTLTVVLVLYLRRYLGDFGTLFAALFVALSPGLVFISRYFIHETFFIFLTFAMAVAITMFIEKWEAGPGAIAWMSAILWTCLAPSAIIVAGYLGGENTAENATALWSWRIAFLGLDAGIVYFVMRSLLTWDDGRPIYALLAAACVALTFATKETGFITMGTMGIACVSIFVWRKFGVPQLLEKRLWLSLVVVNAIGAVVVLYYQFVNPLCIKDGENRPCYTPISDSVKFLYNDLIKNAWRPPEYFVFYCLLFVAAMALVVWFLYVSDYKRARSTDLEEPVDLTVSDLGNALSSGTPLIVIATAAALSVYLFTLFFTSFFTWKEGFWKAFEAYNIWAKTGNKEHAFNGTWAYLKWCTKLEGPIMIISAIGLLVSFIKASHRWAMFAGLWAWGLFAAYTIIPYKTPWLAISFILPMCISAGYALGEMLESRNRRLRIATLVLIAGSLALLCYQTYQLNFVRYDDDQMGYVYAHTKHGYKDLIAKIEHYAEKSGKGYDAQIEIVSPDYWPMTWDLNKYGKAYFQGRLVDATTAEMVVTKKGEQDAQIVPKYSEHYKFAGYYPLRPGVDLCLLVRNDLADDDAQDLSKIPTLPSLP